jgi:SET domain-containing protein
VHQSWLTPFAEVRDAGAKGLGVFATRDIPAGTTVAGFGGHVVERTEFDLLEEELRTHSLQVDDRLYLVSLPPFAPADYVNHSCEPNCGIVGSLLLVAMVDVSAGEELCFDYAMTDTNDYDEFVCACGAPGCRRLITGGDWRLPELQERYRGYFSAYITRKIAQTTAPE